MKNLIKFKTIRFPLIGQLLKTRLHLSLMLGVTLLNITGCKKFVDIDPPVTSLASANIYSTDATAISAITGIYTNMMSGQGAFATSTTSISFYAGLSADDYSLYTGVNSLTYQAYYKNALSQSAAGYELWISLYNHIFTCNSAIEGLSASKSLTPAVQQQLLGEAKFVRGLCYFYLTSFYGDIPLPLTTDYKTNSTLSRTPANGVYPYGQYPPL